MERCKDLLFGYFLFWGVRLGMENESAENCIRQLIGLLISIRLLLDTTAARTRSWN